MQELCVGKTSKKGGARFLKHMFWQISAFSELLPTLFLESERKHMKKIWIFLGPLCNWELLTHPLSTIPTTFPCHQNDERSWSNGALESSSADSEAQQSRLSLRRKRTTPILLASLILDKQTIPDKHFLLGSYPSLLL